MNDETLIPYPVATDLTRWATTDRRPTPKPQGQALDSRGPVYRDGAGVHVKPAFMVPGKVYRVEATDHINYLCFARDERGELMQYTERVRLFNREMKGEGLWLPRPQASI